MGALGEVLGGHHEFVHRGKQYKVSLVTNDILLAFERKQFQKARDLARELRECMTGEEYRDHLKKLNDDYMAGVYSFEGEIGQKALQTTTGMLTFSALLFGCDEVEMLVILKDRKLEVASLVSLIIKESFNIDQDAEQAAG